MYGGQTSQNKEEKKYYAMQFYTILRAMKN